ncbi:YCF48-related protein [Paenibacillus sp. CMAA1364]
MKSPRHIVLTLFLLFGIWLTGCSNDNVTLPTPQPTQEDNIEIEQGQTLNIVEPDTVDVTPDEKSEYQIQTRLMGFQLLDQNTGLAWGVTRKSLRLYLTEDNGLSWINISPAENVRFTDIPKYGVDIYFLDQNNGWIIRSGQDNKETLVLRTTDGGKQWKISSLPRTDLIKGVSFSSLSRGWIITSSETLKGQEEKYLYRTDDGGANWTKIMQNTGSSTSTNDTMGSISNKGYIQDITFVDALHGLVILQDMQLPVLYITKDGGNTWNPKSDLLDMNKMGSCNNVALNTIRFFDRTQKNGFVPVQCTNDSGTKFNALFTTDNGRNWRFTPLHLNWVQGLNHDLAPIFINGVEGWYLKESSVYHTMDQGNTWRALPFSEVLQNKMKKYPSVIKWDFISSEIGWILLENKDEERSLLLQTNNGGISWKVL